MLKKNGMVNLSNADQGQGKGQGKGMFVWDPHIRLHAFNSAAFVFKINKVPQKSGQKMEWLIPTDLVPCSWMWCYLHSFDSTKVANIIETVNYVCGPHWDGLAVGQATGMNCEPPQPFTQFPLPRSLLLPKVNILNN